MPRRKAEVETIPFQTGLSRAIIAVTRKETTMSSNGKKDKGNKEQKKKAKHDLQEKRKLKKEKKQKSPFTPG